MVRAGAVLGTVSQGLAMNNTSIFRIVAAAAVVAAGVVGGDQAAMSAKAAVPEQHCVIEVTGVEDGVFVTQPDVCFASQGVAALHAASVSARRSGPLHHLARVSNTKTIGLHYTSTSYGGSSVRIVGTTCGGGVWYPTGRWNNNIESSRHYCGSSPTTFYDSASCSGPPYPIYLRRNSLGQMNDRASCVRYG